MNSSVVQESLGVCQQPDERRESRVESQQQPNSQQPAASGSGFSSLVSRLFSQLPTVVVLLLIVAVGFLGHHTEWKLPTFAAISGAAKIEKVDWCTEHGVPESRCVECRRDLMPKLSDHGWCARHGVAQCPWCHPDIVQVPDVPNVSPADVARAERALALRPREENNPKCTLYRRRLQLASLDAVKKAGIDVEPVDRLPLEEIVAANGEITYDPTRVARLSAKAAGTAWRVERQVGDRVTRGEVLALIDAVDVGRAKAELLEALAQWEFHRETQQRLSPLAEKGAVAGSRTLQTETSIREARSRALRAQQTLVNLGLVASLDELQKTPADQLAAKVQFLGLPAEIVQPLDPASTTSNLVLVTAPFDGVVTTCDVVAGEVVEATKALFTVADTTQMWLRLHVALEDAPFVSKGQLVRFRTSATRDEVQGRIAWISTTADEQTRTIQVRAPLDNPDGLLRNETFGTGQIVLRAETDAIVVPREAVQWDGSCRVVFVRDKHFFASDESPKVFYPRPVRLGAQREGVVEILAGVLPGEIVATKGSGVLRGELLKNSLGEGCMCEH